MIAGWTRWNVTQQEKIGNDFSRRNEASSVHSLRCIIDRLGASMTSVTDTVEPAEAGSTVSSRMPGWQLLKGRDFSLLFWGQMMSQVGDSLNRVALLWFVYQLTGSAMKMVVIGLLQTIPPLVLSPLIGVYLDRANKKTVMVWVDIART